MSHFDFISPFDIYIRLSSFDIYILDAFCRCVVTYHPQDTYIVWETRSPTWDTMLVFNDIELWGDVQEFVVNPPVILLEIFDKDPGVSQIRSIY